MACANEATRGGLVIDFVVSGTNGFQSVALEKKNSLQRAKVAFLTCKREPDAARALLKKLAGENVNAFLRDRASILAWLTNTLVTGAYGTLRDAIPHKSKSTRFRSSTHPEPFHR